MKSRFYLLLLLIYTAISRLFFLTTIPPMVNSSPLTRMLSASANLGSIFFLFFISKNYFKSTKMALLSVWFFAGLPWVFSEGRIVSQPNTALFFILLMILLANRYLNSSTSGESLYAGYPRGVLKFFLLLLIIPILYFAYPQAWIFKMQEFKLNLSSFMTNFFILTSLDFLFFKNITFWWGGVREFGIMFLSFIPFFILGLYRLIISKGKNLLILLSAITVIAALSPFFPESREFYFVTPIISWILASGVYDWLDNKTVTARAIFIFVFIFMVYEFFQFFHFYFVHYPQQIVGNISSIHEPF